MSWLQLVTTILASLTVLTAAYNVPLLHYRGRYLPDLIPDITESLMAISYVKSQQENTKDYLFRMLDCFKMLLPAIDNSNTKALHGKKATFLKELVSNANYIKIINSDEELSSKVSNVVCSTLLANLEEVFKPEGSLEEAQQSYKIVVEPTLKVALIILRKEKKFPKLFDYFFQEILNVNFLKLLYSPLREERSMAKVIVDLTMFNLVEKGNDQMLELFSGRVLSELKRVITGTIGAKVNQVNFLFETIMIAGKCIKYSPSDAVTNFSGVGLYSVMQMEDIELYEEVLVSLINKAISRLDSLGEGTTLIPTLMLPYLKIFFSDIEGATELVHVRLLIRTLNHPIIVKCQLTSSILTALLQAAKESNSLKVKRIVINSLAVFELSDGKNSNVFQDNNSLLAFYKGLSSWINHEQDSIDNGDGILKDLSAIWESWWDQVPPPSSLPLGITHY